MTIVKFAVALFASVNLAYSAQVLGQPTFPKGNIVVDGEQTKTLLEVVPPPPAPPPHIVCVTEDGKYCDLPEGSQPGTPCQCSNGEHGTSRSKDSYRSPSDHPSRPY